MLSTEPNSGSMTRYRTARRGWRIAFWRGCTRVLLTVFGAPLYLLAMLVLWALILLSVALNAASSAVVAARQAWRRLSR